MKDFVSNRVRVVGLAMSAMSMSVVWAIFILQGFPWTGLVWMSLACSAALWVGTSSTPSISQVIDDVEAESVRVVATPVSKAVL